MFMPPQIIQHFDSKLLSFPAPKFKDDAETLWKIYLYLKEAIFKKAQNTPRRQEKLLILENKFLEVYGIAQAKEKDIEAKTGEPAKKSFYFIGNIDTKNEKIFSRIRYRRSTKIFARR